MQRNAVAAGVRLLCLRFIPGVALAVAYLQQTVAVGGIGSVGAKVGVDVGGIVGNGSDVGDFVGKGLGCPVGGAGVGVGGLLVGTGVLGGRDSGLWCQCRRVSGHQRSRQRRRSPSP